ncbi:hypothetical protein DV515_00018408, partial [Chloebia gouldiae]
PPERQQEPGKALPGIWLRSKATATLRELDTFQGSGHIPGIRPLAPDTLRGSGPAFPNTPGIWTHSRVSERLSSSFWEHNSTDGILEFQRLEKPREQPNPNPGRIPKCHIRRDGQGIIPNIQARDNEFHARLPPHPGKIGKTVEVRVAGGGADFQRNLGLFSTGISGQLPLGWDPRP